MPYPPPQPETLHDWAVLCNVDEIVAQALHAIDDPLLRPVEDILTAPTVVDLKAIKACCKQWMEQGHYRRSGSVNFDGVRLRITL